MRAKADVRLLTKQLEKATAKLEVTNDQIGCQLKVIRMAAKSSSGNALTDAKAVAPAIVAPVAKPLSRKPCKQACTCCFVCHRIAKENLPLTRVEICTTPRLAIGHSIKACEKITFASLIQNEF
jgi:hypothetical protein